MPRAKTCSAGGDGEDVSYGGGGKEAFYGGDGNDLFPGSDDGQRDELHCGEGRDEYVADEGDHVDGSCEKEREWIDFGE